MKNITTSLLLILLVSLSAFSQVETVEGEGEIKVVESISDTEGIVEIEPEFIGGQVALQKFLKENLQYPQVAVDSNYQGKVYVSFVVEKDGSVTNAIIKRGVHPSLDKEVLRILAIMPKWKPGLKNNEPIRSRFMLPVKFQLGTAN